MKQLLSTYYQKLKVVSPISILEISIPRRQLERFNYFYAMLIYLIGMPGSGKTTLGRELANSLNLSLIDMDLVIEEKEKCSIPDLFSKNGENYFRDIERLVLHEVSQKDKAIISCGGGAPCFFDNIEYMNRHGKTIFIDVSPEELFNRMNSSDNAAKRPLLNGKTENALLQELKDKLAYRKQFYNQAQTILTGDNLQVQDLLSIQF